MAQPTTEIQLDNYIVAYFDLLGQGAVYERFPVLKSKMNADQIDELKQVLGRAIFRLLDFHNTINEICNSKPIIPLNFDKSPLEVQASYIQLTHTKLKQQMFSDGFMLFMGVDSKKHNPIAALYEMLAAVGGIFYMSLGMKTPLRGGIEIGLGTIVEDKLYGPAISRAYHLESNIASYPRIVVGNDLSRYVQDFSEIAGSSVEAKQIREYATKCKGFIGTDIDGIYYIEAFNRQYRDMIVEMGGDPERIFNDCIKFAESEYNRFSDMQNSKLATRYHLLLNDLEYHRAIWRK